MKLTFVLGWLISVMEEKIHGSTADSLDDMSYKILAVQFARICYVVWGASMHPSDTRGKHPMKAYIFYGELGHPAAIEVERKYATSLSTSLPKQTKSRGAGHHSQAQAIRRTGAESLVEGLAHATISDQCEVKEAGHCAETNPFLA